MSFFLGESDHELKRELSEAEETFFSQALVFPTGDYFPVGRKDPASPEFMAEKESYELNLKPKMLRYSRPSVCRKLY